MRSANATTRYVPPFGLPVMTLVAKDNCLVAALWQDLARQHTICQTPVLQQTIQELDEYFAGERQHFDIAIDVTCGSEFQKQVWQQLGLIAYGQTLSYQEVAKQINRPNAYRAVGNANGKNPLAIIIPCHRVVKQGGDLGGYSAGSSVKKTLLWLERQHISKNT